jgi:hypothetical protein
MRTCAVLILSGSMAMVGYDMSILGPLLSLPMFAEKYQGNAGPLTVSRYSCN